MLNVVFVRVGERYGPDYVRILADMVQRNLSTADRALWCITDDPDSLPDGVNAIPADPALPGWWQKVRLFSRDMPWEEGAPILYLDLDVAITGRLEDFAETKGIVQDWGWPCFNSSVMRWDHGEHCEIWERFTPDVMSRPACPELAPLLPTGQVNGGDQEWITAVSTWPLLPAGWCLSYRMHAERWPPAGSKVVCFHGLPKPHEILDGWVPNIWKVGGFTSLPVMNGANVTAEFIRANVEANLARELPWFSGYRPHLGECVIVCGGPSMKGRISNIRKRWRRGAKVITVNNSLRYLLEHGIKPHAHVMLDARPENIEFLKDAPAGIRYLLATQCHPSLFEALEGREVVVWHNFISEDLLELLEPYRGRRAIVPVPGGGTVGLRAMNLAWLSGFRRVHLYGLDGSYDGDSHHAYPQALNDEERTLEVQHGERRFRCALWMIRQAEEFREAYAFLKEQGVQLTLHGDGLIPDIWRTLRAEGAAA